MKKLNGGTFRVHIEDKETEEHLTYTITAGSPDEASNLARKKYVKPCVVRKCKLDRADIRV